MSNQAIPAPRAAFTVEDLAPTASYLLLECVGDSGAALAVVEKIVTRSMSQTSRGVERDLLAKPIREGVVGDFPYSHSGWVTWKCSPESSLVPQDCVKCEYEVATVTFFRGYIAVAGEARVREAVRRLVRRNLWPSLRCVHSGTLLAIFDDAAKVSVSLYNTSPVRRGSTAATQRYGMDLGSGFSPTQDGAMAMRSARSLSGRWKELAPNTFGEKVGWSADDASVSLGTCTTWTQFHERTLGLLEVVADHAQVGPRYVSAAPLARRVTSVTGVGHACEISFLSEEIVEQLGDDDLTSAARTLAHCQVGIIKPHSTGCGFDFEIGPATGLAGWLTCTIHDGGADLRVRFGCCTGRPPSNAEDLRPLARALHNYPGLAKVIFASGHTLQYQRLFIQDSMPPFKGWQFQRFTGCDTTQEKPRHVQKANMLGAIGSDDSLFSWVLQEYGPRGFVFCDDGSGEVADFVVITDDCRLILIHVKAATGNPDQRDLKVTALEQVVAQATKNVTFVKPSALLARLRGRTGAAWYHGKPVPASELLDYLEVMRGEVQCQQAKIVVVQPHITRQRWEAKQAQHGPGASWARRCQVDLLLWGLWDTGRGHGADVEVVGMDL